MAKEGMKPIRPPAPVGRGGERCHTLFHPMAEAQAEGIRKWSLTMVAIICVRNDFWMTVCQRIPVRLEWPGGDGRQWQRIGLGRRGRERTPHRQQTTFRLVQSHKEDQDGRSERFIS